MGEEQHSNNDDENETGHTSALPISEICELFIPIGGTVLTLNIESQIVNSLQLTEND